MNSKYSMVNTLIWVGWPSFLITVAMVLFFTCTGKSATARENTENRNKSKDDLVREFRMINIPDSITSPEARADYLTANYWEFFDFNDTTFIHSSEITEQAFVNFLDALNYTRKENIAPSINKLLSAAIAGDKTGRMYAYFLDMFTNYAYNPNSPMLNEELYIPVTEYIVTDTVSDEPTKERAAFALIMMLKNRKGTHASDITYITTENRKGNLYKLNKAYTLVYFNNPTCKACKETTAYLQSSQVFNLLLQTGKLDILAVYPDNDLALWKEYAKDLPPQWIIARDELQTIRKGLLYDLRAMPTIYLLDKEKTVLLKDVSAHMAERYLEIELASK